MGTLRKLTRTVAHNKSYRECNTTDMFGHFFSKLWREKGHPANLNKDGYPSATKKGHKPCCING